MALRITVRRSAADYPGSHQDPRRTLLEIVKAREGERPVMHVKRMEVSPAGPQRLGNHYHARKTELAFVERGRLVATVVDVKTGERNAFVLEPGHSIAIPRHHAHAYEADAGTVIFEFQDAPYDPADDAAYRV